jgi:hypothetical protein
MARRYPRLTLNDMHELSDEALVTRAEAAAFLAVSVNTLASYASQRPGDGPRVFRLYGRTVRYKMGDLRQFPVKGELRGRHGRRLYEFPGMPSPKSEA